MINRMYKAFSICCLCIYSLAANAQCEITNHHFQGGEKITYDLYFKYGILFKKAGNSTMMVEDVIYNDQKAYKMTLTAKSTGLVKSFFSIADTLSSYTTRELVPLAYTKDAHEEGDHTTERATYEYLPGEVRLRNINIRNGNLRYDTTHVSNNCMYDMVNIVYYARTLDFGNMKKGDKTPVTVFSGRRMINMAIEYQGTENVSANNGQKYNCLKLSLLTNAAAFDSKDEAMKVYITNDLNRIPIRIDSKLKVGSTRVVLKNFEGLKY